MDIKFVTENIISEEDGGKAFLHPWEQKVRRFMTLVETYLRLELGNERGRLHFNAVVTIEPAAFGQEGVDLTFLFQGKVSGVPFPEVILPLFGNHLDEWTAAKDMVYMLAAPVKHAMLQEVQAKLRLRGEGTPPLKKGKFS